MANESASLNEEQTSAVAHLQEIAGCSTDEAVVHLVQANWNLETAVNNFFNPNPAPAPPPPPLVNEAIDNSEESFPRLRPSRQRDGTSYSEVAASSINDTSQQPSSSSSPSREQNGHQVAPNQNNAVGIWSILQPVTELVFLPFRYAFSLIGTIIRILASFWSRPAIPSGLNRAIDATGDVEAFITEIQQRYSGNGGEMPNFYRGAYAAALREAQRELVFLLVYIHADDNPNAEAFCRRVLTDPRFKDFITGNRVLLWGCNIGRSEGQRVAHTVRAIQFPVLALISLKHSAMTIILRISGARMADATEEVVASLSRAVVMENAHLNEERERRRQQAAQQELLREQDRLYAETVRHDVERQRARAEREASEAAAARAAVEERHAREERRRQVFDQIKASAASLPAEPSADNGEAVQLVVRLPPGAVSQLRRRFSLTDSVSTLYEWIHAGYWSSIESMHVLQLVISYPKRELPLPPVLATLLSDRSAAVFETTVEETVCTSISTLKEIGITKSQVLLAVMVEEEDTSSYQSGKTE